MPKGPKGQRRPADLNKRALAVVRIATGEDVEPPTPPRGQAGGHAGGPARSKALSADERRAIAQRAARARWKDSGN